MRSIFMKECKLIKQNGLLKMLHKKYLNVVIGHPINPNDHRESGRCNPLEIYIKKEYSISKTL